MREYAAVSRAIQSKIAAGSGDTCVPEKPVHFAPLQAAPLEEFLRNTIETRPYTAVAVALGLGWFIGRMGGRADY